MAGRDARDVYLNELWKLEMQDLRAAGLWDKGSAQEAQERLSLQHERLRNLAKKRLQEAISDVKVLSL